MVNRINRAKHWQDAAPSYNYFPDTTSPKKSQPKENPRFDDLIVALAGAHENARARQVTEWERMRQQTFSISV